MKKLMIASALVAFCGAVMADGGIESANIVGYQDITIPAGYSMYTVTFKQIGANSFDIRNIIICNAEGTVMDDSTSALRSRNKILVQKLNATTGSLYEDGCKFHSRNGWLADDGTPLTANQITLSNAEGVYINNTHDTPMKLRVSGEVELTPVSAALPSGYSIVGNMTPATVDVKDIKILNPDGVEYDDSTSALRSRNKVLAQKLNAETGSLYEDGCKFHSRNGWLTDDGTPLTAEQITLAPGESLYVNNTHENTIYFKFPAPMAAE